MVRYALLIGLALLSACHAAPWQFLADEPHEVTFVLPGTFSEQTTVAELQRRFGKANVKIITVSEAGDDSGEPVVLFPSDPTRRAYVRFHDSQALTGLASISVRDAGSRWRGKHGVSIGMSFAELRQVNEKPFGFSGFDPSYRGWAHDQWSPALDDDDDRLGALDVSEGERMSFGVTLALRDPVENIPPDAYPHDEVAISSDDPRFPRLGELVDVVEINATTSLDDEWG